MQKYTHKNSTSFKHTVFTLRVSACSIPGPKIPTLVQGKFFEVSLKLSKIFLFFFLPSLFVNLMPIITGKVPAILNRPVYQAIASNQQNTTRCRVNLGGTSIFIQTPFLIFTPNDYINDNTFYRFLRNKHSSKKEPKIVLHHGLLNSITFLARLASTFSWCLTYMYYFPVFKLLINQLYNPTRTPP